MTHDEPSGTRRVAAMDLEYRRRELAENIARILRVTATLICDPLQAELVLSALEKIEASLEGLAADHATPA